MHCSSQRPPWKRRRYYNFQSWCPGGFQQRNKGAIFGHAFMEICPFTGPIFPAGGNLADPVPEIVRRRIGTFTGRIIASAHALPKAS